MSGTPQPKGQTTPFDEDDDPIPGFVQRRGRKGYSAHDEDFGGYYGSMGGYGSSMYPPPPMKKKLPPTPKTSEDIAVDALDEIQRLNAQLASSNDNTKCLDALVLQVYNPQLRPGDKAILLSYDEVPDYAGLSIELVTPETPETAAVWEIPTLGVQISASCGFPGDLVNDARPRQVTMELPSLNPKILALTTGGAVVTIFPGVFHPVVGEYVTFNDQKVIIDRPDVTLKDRKLNNSIWKTSPRDYVGYNNRIPSMSAMVKEIIPHVEKPNTIIIEPLPGMTLTVNNDLEVDFEVGDTILVDKNFTTVLELEKKGDQSKRKKSVRSKVGKDKAITWDDIVGLEKAKEAIEDGVIIPYANAKLYAAYGQHQPPKGMLMSGPPGNGKTLLGKAVASTLANGDPDAFIYVKSTELLMSFVGESEKAVRDIFQRANKYYDTKGKPAVIFIDECDAILASRSYRDGTQKNLVAPFLTEMDGFDDSRAFVILATNRPDILDPAVTRDGRVDFKVYVERPNKINTLKMFDHYLKKAGVSQHVTIANELTELVWDSKQVVRKVQLKNGKHVTITMSEVLNGAMIAGIVKSAVTKAVRRDIAAATSGKPEASGLTSPDLTAAVADAVTNATHLSHEDVLLEMIDQGKISAE